MKTTLALFAALAISSLCAQPVFLHPDAIPAFGGYPVETRNYGVVPGLVTTGSNVVWDFSAQGFTVVGTTTDSILEPTATAYASDFPTATHAVRLVNQFGYYRVNEEAVLDLGTRLSAGSPSQINIDPARIVMFPTSVEDTWTDQVATSTSTSELQVTILAEGTIILSDAVIPDAVLVERRYIFSSTTSISTTWFRKSDCLVPLGNVLANGAVIVRVPEALTTAVSERPLWAVVVTRDPVTGQMVISRNDGQAIGLVHVFDAMGREVINTQAPASRMEIDLRTHPTGTYAIHVNATDGTRVAKVLHTR